MQLQHCMEININSCLNSSVTVHFGHGKCAVKALFKAEKVVRDTQIVF